MKLKADHLICGSYGGKKFPRELRSKFANMADNKYKKILEVESQKLRKAVVEFCRNLGGEISSVGQVAIWNWPSTENYSFHLGIALKGMPPPYTNRSEGVTDHA